MARTPLLRQLLDTMRRASATDPRDDADVRDGRGVMGRRDVLHATGVALGALAAPRFLGGCTTESGDESMTLERARSGIRAVNADIGIVGAGMAGLACAYELKRAGAVATLHEASARVGGRVFSMGGAFAGPVDWQGQVIERGGEFIDTPHRTMLGYANELNLQVADVTKPKRDTFYYFGGQRIAESTIVEEYRVLVDRMRDDLRAVGAPTADSHTPADVVFDQMSLAEWLDSRGAAPNIKALLRVAYTIEYGAAPEALSSLAFLFYAKASRQSKLRLFGNFSDERYSVIGGNEQIPAGLAARLPGQIKLGRKLVAARKRADGRIELTMKEGNKTITATHDGVVFALPFHLLRNVALDPSLGLPQWKRDAIANVVYGDNAKLMVGFAGRPWVEQGGNGTCYSDLAHLQCAWETDPSRANATRAILTDYSGDALARSLSPSKVQADCGRFLDALEWVVPGARARARKSQNAFVCHLEHWPSNPLTQGAYTANQPGYFTTIAGREAPPVGNVYFAGETTDSFYSWQGFMEGASLSGLRAASEIARDFR